MGAGVIIMVVWEFEHVVNPLMVSVVNNLYGTNLKAGATFRNFYESRNDTRGYFKEKQGSQVWVVPMINHGFTSIDKKVVEFLTVEEYEKIDFDPEPENLII